MTDKEVETLQRRLNEVERENTGLELERSRLIEDQQKLVLERQKLLDEAERVKSNGTYIPIEKVSFEDFRGGYSNDEDTIRRVLALSTRDIKPLTEMSDEERQDLRHELETVIIFAKIVNKKILDIDDERDKKLSREEREALRERDKRYVIKPASSNVVSVKRLDSREKAIVSAMNRGMSRSDAETWLDKTLSELD